MTHDKSSNSPDAIPIDSPNEQHAILVERGWTPDGAAFLVTKVHEEPNHPVSRYLRRKFFSQPVKKSKHKPQTPKAVIPDYLRWEVWERDDFTCQHCGTRQRLSLDHVIPESKGGLTVLENLQTLCRACNSRKGARV